jgi:hypothetical protein
MRFQGDDALHRFFKFFQVILFIYQGASSGNWDPGKIQVWQHDSESDAEDYGAKLASHRDAARSWLTVVVAFAVSRALLAVQYGICEFNMEWQRGRGADAEARTKGTRPNGMSVTSFLRSTRCVYRSSWPSRPLRCRRHHIR